MPTHTGGMPCMRALASRASARASKGTLVRMPASHACKHARTLCKHAHSGHARVRLPTQSKTSSSTRGSLTSSGGGEAPAGAHAARALGTHTPACERTFNTSMHTRPRLHGFRWRSCASRCACCTRSAATPWARRTERRVPARQVVCVHVCVSVLMYGCMDECVY